MFMQCFASPSACSSYACQLAVVYSHTLCPLDVTLLLTYTHSSLSCSVGFGVYVWCAGCVCAVSRDLLVLGYFCVCVGVEGILCVCVLCVCCRFCAGWRFYVVIYLLLAASLAMRMSICLF